MAKRIAKDKNQIYEDIKSGLSMGDIMKAHKFNTRQQFKSYVYELSLEKNEILQVVGGKSRTRGTRKYQKTGIIIPSSLLSESFEIGDAFKMSINGDSITLKKV
jgi:hypothetical protein